MRIFFGLAIAGFSLLGSVAFIFNAPQAGWAFSIITHIYIVALLIEARL